MTFKQQHLVLLGTDFYVCLLVGRGLKSHAYTHSVQFTHHVFLNLHTLKFYCLPDNYEIIDSSLEDITVKYNHGVTDSWHFSIILNKHSKCLIRFHVQYHSFKKSKLKSHTEFCCG